MIAEIDRSPARLSSTFAVGAMLIAATAIVLVGGVGTFAGLIGALVIATGVVTGSRRGVTLGSGVLLIGLLSGAVTAAPAELLLPGMMATVLAWDLGEQAINVGEQLGRDADTRRLELAHAAASTVVAVIGGAIGYGIYRVGVGNQPVTALVFLLLAALALASALRN